MNENTQLATTSPQSMSYDDMERMAKHVAESGLFGLTKPAQAMCLFALCQSEGMNPIDALRTYHIVEGKPSMRADAIQGKFQARGGGIIFHVRTDDLVCATYFAEKSKIDDDARARAAKRFEILWQLDAEKDPAKRGKHMVELSKLSRDGEETVLRTYANAIETGLALTNKIDEQGNYIVKTNWDRNKRAMLTARNVSEGVRVIDPGLIAGIYTPEEQQDIADQNRENTQQILTNGASPTDRAAIEAMIAQHLEEAKTASPTRKSELQGLAAELRVTLADMDAPKTEPAKAVETVILPPEPKPTTPPPPKTPRKKAPPEPSEPADETPWQEVVCHLGKAQGPILGKKVSEIIKPDSSESHVTKLSQWFEAQIGTSADAKDAALLKAIREGVKAWQEAQKSTQVAPEPKTATPTPPAPETSATAPAASKGWQDYEVQSKNPAYHGRKLGTFAPDELKDINEHLSRVDWSKATLSQKALKANMALATAAHSASAQAVESKTAPHTAQLLDKLTESKISIETFLRECSKIGFIEYGDNIHNVSPDEVSALLQDWDSVIAQCYEILQ